jgi:hypothetical protein
MTGSYPGTYQGHCTLGAAGALSSGDFAVELDGHSCRISIGEPSSNGPLVLGDYLQTDPNKLEGRLDHVAIYAVELTAAQVAAHFAAR